MAEKYLTALDEYINKVYIIVLLLVPGRASVRVFFTQLKRL